MTTAVATKFEIQVLYNGVTERLSVEGHERVKAELERAMNALHITKNRHILALFRTDGTEVAEGQSVTQAGIVPGELLGLRPSAVKGGRR